MEESDRRLTYLSHLLFAAQLEAVCVSVVVGFYDDEVT